MDKKLTIAEIRERKGSGQRVVVLTAYDAAMARVLDSEGVDIVLVGDSLGMVLLGYDSTVPVTMDEMLHHCRAASRGVQRALLVADMPFLSYQVEPAEAVRNAGRFLKEAGCDAVKIEGGVAMADTVRALIRAGIPVMGHIGLTPQTASQLGGFRVQGKDLAAARSVLADARAIAAAGAFAIVLECLPAELAARVTRDVAVPTIGIGAGSACDGQVLVTHDLLGLFEKFTPRFVKRYAELAPQVRTAIQGFRDEVAAGRFPGPEHSFAMAAEVLARLDEEG
ncbi:MAG: 3-methyl-2-oxobutanoate hydroxymethyltransferase [Thermodesulfobacteriota bacterium]